MAVGCRAQIEYMVISYDDENKNARLSLRQTEILLDLQEDAARRMEEMPGRECVFCQGRFAVPREELTRDSNRACIPVFHPEYGRYMLESTPGMPYGATLNDLLSVEGNMSFRCVSYLAQPDHSALTVLFLSRKLAKSRMKDNEVPLTLTSFPRLGAPGVFTDPYYPPGGDVARSLFLPDEITNPHVRFP